MPQRREDSGYVLEMLLKGLLMGWVEGKPRLP